MKGMNLFNRWMFRTQLNISFTLIILFIIITVMTLIHFVLRNSFHDQERLALQTQARQIAINIDNRMDNYMSYLRLLSRDPMLISTMENGDYQRVKRQLELSAREYLDINAGRISAMRVYRNGIYGVVDGLGNINEIISAFERDTASPGMWISMRYRDKYYVTGAYLNSRNEKVFSVFKRVYQTNANRVYYLEMCLYETEVFGFFNEHTEGGDVSVFFGDKLMSMSNRDQFSRLLYQGQSVKSFGVDRELIPVPKNGIVVSSSLSNGLNASIQTNSDYLDRGYRLMVIRLVPIIGAVMAVALVFVALISVRFNRRLKTLQRKIADLSRWNLEAELSISGKDEFALLSVQLDETRHRIIELIQKNDDTNELMRVSEMSALRAQINSHFLFNSLSSIKWLSRLDRKEALAEAVDCLALFLRYSLSLKEDQVKLESELKQLEAYIYLQKLRYGEELNVHIDIDEELLGEKTLKLVLQPLVENAIYHGRRENGTPLSVTVYSHMDDMSFDLVVEDDGNGIPPERIQEIQDGRVEVSQSGYGLKNVMARIKMSLEGKGSLSIDSQMGVFTRITVRQPRG